MGLLKPLVVDNPPPGEVGNYIFLPPVATALWFSPPRKNTNLDQGP
jgi:hypothetical protein